MDTISRTMDLLDQNNMSLQELCDRCGISKKAIFQAKKRGTQLRVDTIQQICLALNISMSEFFNVPMGTAMTTEILLHSILKIKEMLICILFI